MFSSVWVRARVGIRVRIRVRVRVWVSIRLRAIFGTCGKIAAIGLFCLQMAK